MSDIDPSDREVPDPGQACEPDGHMRRLLAAEQDCAGNLRAAIRDFLGQDTFRDSDEDLIAAMSRAATTTRRSRMTDLLALIIGPPLLWASAWALCNPAEFGHYVDQTRDWLHRSRQ